MSKDQDRAERITKARQMILDEIAEQVQRRANCDEWIERLNLQLAGFDAALHAMNEPEPHAVAKGSPV